MHRNRVLPLFFVLSSLATAQDYFPAPDTEGGWMTGHFFFLFPFALAGALSASSREISFPLAST